MVESKEIKGFSEGFKDSSPRFGYYLDGKNKGIFRYVIVHSIFVFMS